MAIGVTMPHPHGQIYSFPFVPPLVQTELDSASDYFREHNECLYCRILAGEIEDGRRLVEVLGFQGGRSNGFTMSRVWDRANQ